MKRGKSSNLILVLSLISIILLVGLTGCQKEEQAIAPPTQQNNTAPVVDVLPAEDVQEFIEEDRDCGVGTAVGYKACVYSGPDVKDVNMTLEKKQGEGPKSALAGIRVIFVKTVIEGTKKETIEVGNETVLGFTQSGQITYPIALGKYPEAERIEIRPIIEDSTGKKKICYNQRIMVIPSTNCKKV